MGRKEGTVPNRWVVVHVFLSSPTCDDLERSPFDGTFSQSKLINRGVPPIDYPISA